MACYCLCLSASVVAGHCLYFLYAQIFKTWVCRPLRDAWGLMWLPSSTHSNKSNSLHSQQPLPLSPQPASFHRMFTMTKAFEEVLLRHFIQMKLEIAYAINKPFPFFEALRDHCFITEKMYKVRPVDPRQGSPIPTKDAQLLRSRPVTHQGFFVEP